MAKPQPAQQQADAAQPIEKTPIQAALDFFFGRSSGGASDSAAPPTTGAAFR